VSADQDELKGPDLRNGVALGDVVEGKPFAGHDGTSAVLLIRLGAEVFAVGGTCTHYSGPLAEGLLTGDCIRCPWHHARFSVRTGEPLAGPALNALPRWRTSIEGDRVFLREPIEAPVPLHSARIRPRNVVIVGAGAAGAVAAETLRSFDYTGDVILIDPDTEAPYDRPNLSKDYLAGTAPDEWLPLRDAAFYRDKSIQRVAATVTGIDVEARSLAISSSTASNSAISNNTTSSSATISFDALLLATGAAPVKPPIPGADQAHVHTLRSWRDARRLIESLSSHPRVVIAGASFIGLEVAAALRARDVAVTVVAPEAVPFEKVLGREVGAMLHRVHVRHGVEFHLGRTIAKINAGDVELDDASRVQADVVLLAVGVRPLTQLADDAGIRIDKGVVVDAYLQTSVPGVYAAGDIALYPGRFNEAWRIEHWAVAEQQGRTAARNILGMQEPFDNVPFFWTHQYDVQIAYTGHATAWDHAEVDGSLDDGDCRISYTRGGDLLAVATINRDIESLLAEVRMESE
jgi:NADPH-dependent 2,4-dienoyl-CoA reductase/sulfur reductase-like enzyme/nitrite reductase/ring-hydroxylating ferredoxin subunit